MIDVGDYVPRDKDAVQMMIKGLQDADDALCDLPDPAELARRDFMSLDFLGSHENVRRPIMLDVLFDVSEKYPTRFPGCP